MFYTGKEKVRLEAKFFEMQNEIFDLRNRLELLEAFKKAYVNAQIDKARSADKAPYGLKKDGTPKKKPGRKTK
jgi:hypothetical protein